MKGGRDCKKSSAECFVAMNMMQEKQDILLPRALIDSDDVSGCPTEEQSQPQGGDHYFQTR